MSWAEDMGYDAYDDEEDILDEDDQELVYRYETYKNCFIGISKSRSGLSDDNFTLAEIIRLSKLIKQDI